LFRLSFRIVQQGNGHPLTAVTVVRPGARDICNQVLEAVQDAAPASPPPHGGCVRKLCGELQQWKLVRSRRIPIAGFSKAERVYGLAEEIPAT
jgi:hypothetical protein